MLEPCFVLTLKWLNPELLLISDYFYKPRFTFFTFLGISIYPEENPSKASLLKGAYPPKLYRQFFSFRVGFLGTSLRSRNIIFTHRERPSFDH